MNKTTLWPAAATATATMTATTAHLLDLKHETAGGSFAVREHLCPDIVVPRHLYWGRSAHTSSRTCPKHVRDKVNLEAKQEENRTRQEQGKEMGCVSDLSATAPTVSCLLDSLAFVPRQATVGMQKISLRDAFRGGRLSHQRSDSCKT